MKSINSTEPSKTEKGMSNMGVGLIIGIVVIGIVLLILFIIFRPDEDSDDEGGVSNGSSNGDDCEGVVCSNQETINEYISKNNISSDSVPCLNTRNGTCNDGECSYEYVSDGSICGERNQKKCKGTPLTCKKMCNERGSKVINSYSAMRRGGTNREEYYEYIPLFNNVSGNINSLGKVNRQMIDNCPTGFPSSEYGDIETQLTTTSNAQIDKWSWEPCNAYYSSDGFLCSSSTGNNCIDGESCHT